MKIKRIIAIGGCHVTGYLVGESNSFVSVLAARLGLSKEECLVVSHVMGKRLDTALYNAGKLYDEDLVILQLGGFDTLAPFVFGRAHTTKSVDQNGRFSALLCRAGWFPRSLFQIVRLIGNSLLFVIRELINKPAFSTKEFARQIFAPSISQSLSHAGVVIVVGAFPTRDWVRNIYRRRANALLSRFAIEKNYIFIDYLKATGDVPRHQITVDAIHLNKDGHKILGMQIFQIFRNSF
jgi:hypothetical protein